MKPGVISSEFWLYVGAAAFSMWAGYYVLTHPWVEMERFLAVIGAVTAAAWAYGNQRTSLKKEELSNPPTTIIAEKVEKVDASTSTANTEKT